MTSEDPLAQALAAAGLVAPPQPPSDPLAAALAAAGLAPASDATADPPDAPPRRPPHDRRVARPMPPGASAAARTLAAGPAADDAPAALPRWPEGAATGVGSLPGTEPAAAVAVVVGELPVLPHLPELPARGVGADMIGRTAGLLVDITVEVRPSGYRVVPRAGHEHRRAVDLLRFDVDALDEACAAARPGWVKVQAAGPWTLAAAVELRSGHRVLTDRGAVREFTESLTEGLRRHVAEIAARTGAQVLVQLDEPGLPAVLAGSLPTASGYGRVAAVPEPVAQDGLRALAEDLGVPVVVHCCAPRPPVRLLARAGLAGIGVDATALARTGDTALLDALGETWDAAIPLLLGLVPALPPAVRVTAQELARPAFDLADRLGFDRVRLAALAVPTPTCGLAGATPQWARRALGLARELGEMFADPPDRD
ncbi:MAG: methionine synthase [Pseudonocardia sp.]